jgi:hypothetical protein
MGQVARDEQDKIAAQAYWDFRGVLEKLKIVEEKKP